MKENPKRTQDPATKAQGLHNDFSDMEAEMTNSAIPPKFALTASSLGDSGASDTTSDEGAANPHHAELSRLGLSPDLIEGMSPVSAAKLVATSKRFDLGQWMRLREAFATNGLLESFASALHDFYENLDWITEKGAHSIAILPEMPFNTVNGQKTGHVEIVKTSGKVGMRAIIPYGDFSGNLILDPHTTTAVLGRSVDATARTEGFEKAMNEPKGTNYFRYQRNFMVGKNMGGGNVLDVADRTWTWPLNNAWLQAAIDRPDRIQFISDPKKPTTLFKGGGTIKDGLTVTGQELGVLMNRGLAPDPDNGEVQPRATIGEDRIPDSWLEVMKKVKKEGDLGKIDKKAYKAFLHGATEPARSPKQHKSMSGELLATQTNFFEESGFSA